MTQGAWDDLFEAELRRHLKLLPASEPLPSGAGLVELGLDSLEMVSLLVSLESAYDITFSDDELNFDTFATADRLWDTVSRLRVTAA